jgi:chemotaxis protein MotB
MDMSELGKKNKPEEQEEWLTTYADMMTLLMTFFVLLFSMSSLDPIKMEQFGESMGKVLGKKAARQDGRVSLLQISRDVEKIIEENDISDVVEVTHSYRGITVSLKSDILFEKGKAELNPAVYPILDAFTETISQSIYQIAVEGHTDSDPIRSALFPSNWELSTSRASKVVNYYITRGIDADRFRAIGFADTRPKKENTSDENKRANRRVEITFLSIS